MNSKSDKKGYVHIYTGNGKGKTTAAFGLALRALCSGMRVYAGQFVKSMKYNETRAESLFEHFKVEQYGRDCFINRQPEQQDIDMAQEGLKRIEEVIASGDYDVVILDEIFIATYYRLVPVGQLVRLIQNRPPSVELVLTGRYAPKEIYGYADLVTEMVEVKHYYAQGVLSRDGIDR